MRVFITGGTGFIGSHVVRKLQDEGHDLLLLSRNSKKISYYDSLEKTTVVTGDLSSISNWEDELKKFQPDTTIHMAWEGIPDYGYKTSIRNLKYGLDMFTLLAELGCERVITTGSCWEYGQKYGRLSEDTPSIPTNAFTAAKNALHWMGREIAKENNMQFIWTRLFYVYGPGQREASLIPYIINCVRKGKKPEIKTPHARNDFVYVVDVADAITMLVKNCKQSTVYNIGSGYSISVLDIIKIVYDYYDLKCPQEIILTHPTSNSIVDYWADISRIKEISWEPKVYIEEGLQRTIQELKNRKR